MLTMAEVIPYLCTRGVLAPERLVDEEVRVFDMARRNQNYRVVVGPDDALFVKQGTERDGFSGVRREAQVYAMLGAATGAGRGPYRHMPEFVDYDPDRDILIIRYLQGAVDLRRAEGRRRAGMVGAAAGLGRALARLHGAVPVPVARDRVGEGEAGVLTAQRPGLALLRDFSAAGIDLVRLMQRDAELMQRLDDLRRDWRYDAVIHHDVRLENVLYRPGRDTVALVDWETAAVGDRAWDVGAAVGDYLGLWLLSIPGTASHPPDRSLDLATKPLACVQPAITALVESYGRTAGLGTRGRAAFAARVAAFAGLKLLQSAIEQVQSVPRWTVPALCHLQVAANLMSRPEQGSTVLLGLGRSE